MKVNLFKIVILLSVVNFTFSCSGCVCGSDNQRAKNIILFIGDGMGAEHRKAARLFAVGETGKLSMDDMPSVGMIMTKSADNEITDSAAAATAMATGVKTNNGILSLDAGLNYVPTILEKAKFQGKSVGLVTTTQITHATPAAFVSHVENRSLMTQIAEQMLAIGPDILLGGGEDEFLPIWENGCFPEPGKRYDGRHLINEAGAIGYEYVCDPDIFNIVEPSSTLKLVGLFSDKGMTRPFSPSLAEMTQKSIDILSKNQLGFFLMVEAGQIDFASHSNDADNAILDTIGLDEAVEVAKRFAMNNEDNTLIIVVADHETGGMSVTTQSSGLADEDGPFTTPDGKLFYINWATTGHTSANVPVTSQGPLSNTLAGIKDNTYIHDVMVNAFGGM